MKRIGVHMPQGYKPYKWDGKLKYLGDGKFAFPRHGEKVPEDLNPRILKALPVGLDLKNGEIFQVEPLMRSHLMPPKSLQTLHDYLTFLTILQEKYPQENLKLLIALVPKAQIFDFAEIEASRLEKETKRAEDLRDQGFLRLPFDCVIYRYTCNQERVHLIAADNASCIQIGMTEANQTKHHVWPLTLILSSKGIRLKGESVSPKLQAKRIAHGKKPLPYVTYVNTAHYYEAVRNTESKGSHASPVAHLRRGHVREYENGRKIWIKDMLVNCRSLSELTQRQEYRVK